MQRIRRAPRVERTGQHVRVTEHARELWATMAERRGMTLSGWLEETIRQEAERHGVRREPAPRGVAP